MSYQHLKGDQTASLPFAAPTTMSLPICMSATGGNYLHVLIPLHAPVAGDGLTSRLNKAPKQL